MSVTVTAKKEFNPHKIALSSSAKDVENLEPAQEQFWNKVRHIESEVRRHLTVDLSNFYIDQLADIASSALSKKVPNFFDYEKLEALKSDIALDAANVRNKKLVSKIITLSMLFLLGLSFTVFWIFLVSFRGIIDGFIPKFIIEITYMVNFFGTIGIGFMGVAVGAASKSLMSNKNISFDHINELDNYNFTPIIYIIFLCVVYFMSYVFMIYGIFDIVIVGNALSSSINYPPHSFLLGFLCGFSETIISKYLSNTADKVSSAPLAGT